MASNSLSKGRTIWSNASIQSFGNVWTTRSSLGFLFANFFPCFVCHPFSYSAFPLESQARIFKFLCKRLLHSKGLERLLSNKKRAWIITRLFFYPLVKESMVYNLMVSRFPTPLFFLPTRSKPFKIL